MSADPPLPAQPADPGAGTPAAPARKPRPRRDRRPRTRRPSGHDSAPDPAPAPTASPAAEADLPSPDELRARLADVGLRDRSRLGRRLSALGKDRDAARRAQTLTRIVADVENAERRIAARRASVPTITYPDLPVSDRRDDIAAAIRDHQVVVVAGETGQRQDDAAAEDPARARSRHQRADRAHAAAPHRRARRRRPRGGGARRRARRRRRLPGALHRPLERADARQGDDRRHPARRDRARPAARALRHDHHRRGARAVAHHRLPPGLPQGDPAAAPRPQGRHHLGHHRHRALRRALRRRTGGRGQRPHVPGRGALRAVRRGGRRRPRPDPGDQRRRRRAAARGPRRHPRVPLRRARDPRHGRGAEGPEPQGHRDPAALRPALRGRAAQGLRGAQRTPRGAGHQRRRDLADRAGHPVRRRPRHRAHLALLGAAEGAAPADRGDLAGVRRLSARAGAAVSPTASPYASTPRTTSSRGPSSPSRRSCAPTWPR